MYTNNSTIAINTESELRTMEVPATELEQVEPTDNPVVEKPDVAETGTSGPNGEVEAPDEHEDSETGPDIPATETNTDIAASENDSEDATATGADNEAVGGTPETAAEVAISERAVNDDLELEADDTNGVLVDTANQGTTTGSANTERGLDEVKADLIRISQEEMQNETLAKLRQGALIIEAKNLHGEHGKWLSWVKAECGIPCYTAQRLKKVSEVFSETEKYTPNETPVFHLDHSKLYDLTKFVAYKGNHLKPFMNMEHSVGGKKKWVTDMTRAELNVAINQYIKDEGLEKITKTTVSAPSPKQINQRFDASCGSVLEKVKTFALFVERNKDSITEATKRVDELREQLEKLLKLLPANNP